ncbi:hypothetical protein PCASD_19653 [Puccinia coronata f. sp. avenae]|uniref:Uncharacterized protein n=1 Tax=Puccinia coronata f. sp. avenae TaxID=200324 RepID=A0A2N5TLJ7_9BASI|nr:hypothetical protein PCASD_19653 [Puccinia coronata f. sp. avenae]
MTTHTGTTRTKSSRVAWNRHAASLVPYRSQDAADVARPQGDQTVTVSVSELGIRPVGEVAIQIESSQDPGDPLYRALVASNIQDESFIAKPKIPLPRTYPSVERLLTKKGVSGVLSSPELNQVPARARARPAAETPNASPDRVQ